MSDANDTTLDDLDRHAATTLLAGYVNPAPPQKDEKEQAS